MGYTGTTLSRDIASCLRCIQQQPIATYFAFNRAAVKLTDSDTYYSATKAHRAAKSTYITYHYLLYIAARLHVHVTVRDVLHSIKVCSVSDVFTGPGLEVVY